MLAGNISRPEVDCAANQKDAKSSLLDFFTSTVTLVERSKARVPVGERIQKSTGEIVPKVGLRSVKTELAAITTRSGAWALASNKPTAQEQRSGVKVTKKLQAAITLAEQRFMALLHEDSPAHKQTLAVRTFWTTVWDGVAGLPTQPTV